MKQAGAPLELLLGHARELGEVANKDRVRMSRPQSW
jgi:hypothetical protein